MSNHKEKLVAYIHNELDAIEKEDLIKSLQEDEALHEEYTQLLMLHQKLDQWQTEVKGNINDFFTQRLMSQVNKEAALVQVPHFSRKWLSAAVLLFSTGLGLFLWNQNATEHKSQILVKKNVETASNKVSVESNMPQAIQEALGWLKREQNADGSWSAANWGASEKYQVGLSALALLAYVSQDVAFSRHNYEKEVQQASQYLLSTQNEKGCFGHQSNDSLYNHGIATVALFKAKSVFPELPVERPLKKAIDYIVANQNKDGGWGYFAEDSNSSISIWQLHALLLAKQSSFQGSFDHAITASVTWLKTLRNDAGVMGYKGPNDHPFGKETLASMSSILWLYEDLLPGDKIEYKIQFKEDLEKLALSQSKQIDFYQFYFLSNALSTLKIKKEISLVKEVNQILLSKQVAQGPLGGSYHPDDQWGAKGGRIYSTALAAISMSSFNEL